MKKQKPKRNSVYHERAREIADLVVSKQEAYGDAFGQSPRVLEVLYPSGVTKDQMQDFPAVVRVVDKLFRIANKKEAFGEDPWKDIAGYGLLAFSRDWNQLAARQSFGEIRRALNKIVLHPKIGFSRE